MSFYRIITGIDVSMTMSGTVWLRLTTVWTNPLKCVRRGSHLLPHLPLDLNKSSYQ